MLVAVDNGNSSISVGLIETNTVGGQRPNLCRCFKIATECRRSADEYAMILRELLLDFAECITDVVLGSVVPALTYTLREAVTRLTKSVDVPVITVGSGVRTGVGLSVDEPGILGADIVANAAAAVWLYEAPAVILDFGTVTVLSAVNSSRSLVGVSIVSGVRTSLESLRNAAAQIQFVSLEEPGPLLGRNTADAARSGIIYGTACMVDGLIDRLPRDIYIPEKTQLLATGGLASMVIPHCRHVFFYEPELTLLGLWRIYMLTVEREKKIRKSGTETTLPFI